MIRCYTERNVNSDRILPEESNHEWTRMDTNRSSAELFHSCLFVFIRGFLHPRRYTEGNVNSDRILPEELNHEGTRMNANRSSVQLFHSCLFVFIRGFFNPRYWGRRPWLVSACSVLLVCSL